MEFTEDIRNKEKPNSIFEDMYRYPELARILGIPRFIIERYPWGASTLNNMLQLKDVDVSLLGYPGFNYPILISEKFKEVYRDKLYLEIRNTAKDGSVKKGSMIECIAKFINYRKIRALRCSGIKTTFESIYKSSSRHSHKEHRGTKE